jgi:hypothetical protein
VPARTFEDSTGVVWEVFEVHRSSQKAGAVSAGLERGWLAFVSGDSKRRLAPFPQEWQTADATELERLCGMARLAGAAGRTRDARGGTSEASVPTRPRTPRIRPTVQAREAVPESEVPVGASATSVNPVERTVREFAYEARARGLPAIGAMVQLKALLGRVYQGDDPVARDMRAVRRWFVESYYFERDGGRTDGRPSGGDAQSR